MDTQTHTHVYTKGNERGKESTLCFSLYNRFCHPPVCHSLLDYVGLLRLFSSLLRRTTIHSSNARVPISVVHSHTHIHTHEPVHIFLGGIIFLKSIRFASVGVLHTTSSGSGAHLHFEIEIETQRIMAF